MTGTRCVHFVARKVLHATTCKFVTGRGDRFLTLFNSEARYVEIIRNQMTEMRIREQEIEKAH